MRTGKLKMFLNCLKICPVIWKFCLEDKLSWIKFKFFCLLKVLLLNFFFKKKNLCALYQIFNLASYCHESKCIFFDFQIQQIYLEIDTLDEMIMHMVDKRPSYRPKIDNLKNHSFFEVIDWGSGWKKMSIQMKSNNKIQFHS